MKQRDEGLPQDEECAAAVIAAFERVNSDTPKSSLTRTRKEAIAVDTYPDKVLGILILVTFAVVIALLMLGTAL